MPNYFNDGFGRPELDSKLADLLAAPATGSVHVNLGTVSTSLVLNASQGVSTSFVATLTNGSTANITATNVPSSGTAYTAEIELVQPASGSASVNWFPGSTVKYANGVSSLPMSTTSSKTDRFAARTRDGGATWFVDIIGLGY